MTWREQRIGPVEAAGPGLRLAERLTTTSPRPSRTARYVTSSDSPIALATSRKRRAAAIADDGRGERGAFLAVFFVDVGDDFIAPLMLEIDIDIGRFVALRRDEALEQNFA